MDELTAVILAGGGSRRFGTDKADFQVGGRPMIQHVYDAVVPLVQRILISVGSVGESPGGLDADRVIDRFPGRGPLAGIDAALSDADTDWLLVIACDMPYVTRDALRTLIRERTTSAEAVVACDAGGRLHPLCACYRRTIQPRVEQRLGTMRLAVHGLLDELQYVKRVVLPANALQNVNAPGDLRERTVPGDPRVPDDA